MSAAWRASVLALLAAALGPPPAAPAPAPAPAPRQKAPVQFRCELGAVWMENCNECRCQSNNHVVCAHLACLRNAPARPVAETAAAGADPAPGAAALTPVSQSRDPACYQGSCPDECDSRLDESGCHVCHCSKKTGEVTAMMAPPPGEKRRWGFLTVARGLRNTRP
ncbi:hypothetical protein FJT64_016153 [Amphibalanus amphitrite]|uniref:Pacifastin domain-containing protein n=1 Tax=Amphibalanus amphitrite TaxID=1232801 RepID=A0A6A4XAL3_AMPAM|nr:hypothetical protein FJT64_016153 [Amphibalanus amphitrite]